MARLGGMHFKIRGGAKIPALKARPSSGLPVRPPNPFKQARLMVKRSIGPAKAIGRPY